MLAVGDGGVDVASLNGVEVVFNLVESPPGRPGFQVEAATAFEDLGLKITGSCADVIRATTDKHVTRLTLAKHGVAVAPGVLLDPNHPELLDNVPPPWILKPALEDASLGLNGDAVASDLPHAVSRARRLQSEFPGQGVLVEHLLPGREFNISVLADGAGIEILPPAEMTFVDFPPERPRILDWQAKWEETSFAYRNTVRVFLDGFEPPLRERLEGVAHAAWSACRLAGYGRVDIRLDENGVPCVLEVNANPCLSSNAGFAAAVREAGYNSSDLVLRILAAAGWTP